MSEIYTKDTRELKNGEIDGYKDIKPESNIQLNEAKSFFDTLFAQPEVFFKSYSDRWEKTPAEDSEHGKWEGTRGESVFIPNEADDDGLAAKDRLSEYGLNGIGYHNAEPAFSTCSEATVEIDDMTEHRSDYLDEDGNQKKGNFSQADTKCAEFWNLENKDGRNDWKAVSVREYRHEHLLSWHERCDMKTMDLVPQEIHSWASHSGGVAECKARDNSITGDGFDE